MLNISTYIHQVIPSTYQIGARICIPWNSPNWCHRIGPLQLDSVRRVEKRGEQRVLTVGRGFDSSEPWWPVVSDMGDFAWAKGKVELDSVIDGSFYLFY